MNNKFENEAIDNNTENKSMYPEAEMRRIKAELFVKKRRDENSERALLKSIIKYPTKEVEWVCDDLIPIGKITIIAGDPGVGKSLILKYITGNISIGNQVFNKKTMLGDSIILSAEDDISDTIRPRLEALGADLSKIHTIDTRIARDNRKFVTIKDIESISDSVDQINSKDGNLCLLAIDPLDSFLGGTNSFRNSDVREAFDGLLRLASEKRFAILLITHLNKTLTTSAYRIGGSIAIPAMARSVYIAAKDINDSEKRVLLPLKNNLANDTSGFQYSIQQTYNNIPYINFEKEIIENLDKYLTPNFPVKKNISPEQEEILNLLENEYPNVISTREIAEKLQKKDNNISMMLGKLENKGKIKKIATGQWIIEKGLRDSANSANSKEVINKE